MDRRQPGQAYVITIEEIEYVHRHGRSVVNQRAVGRTPHHSPRPAACPSEDPTNLLVGELRDLESIRVALTLAETGHLVFGTVAHRTTPCRASTDWSMCSRVMNRARSVHSWVCH